MAIYHGPILTRCDAMDYLEALLTRVSWRNDETVVFGRHIVTAREVAWYGEASYSYRYSGTDKTALPWTQELLSLKKLVEGASGASFNSCLCNLYHDGSEGMGWHSDDERSLGRDTAIASLSLGAERRFAFRHKRKREGGAVTITLEDGSLLVMKGATQRFWQHSVPKSKKIKAPRVSLTFRTMAG